MLENALRKAVFRLFGCRAGFSPRSALAGLGLCLPLIAGCQAGQSDSEALKPYAEQARSVFAVDEPAAASPGVDGGVVEPTWWSVLVAAVPSGRLHDAERMLSTVHATGLTEAYIAVRDDRPVIALGRYAEPGEPAAQEGLKRVRETAVGEARPFAAAMLMPPVVVRAGSEGDELNLRTVKRRFGEDRAVYTLQIGAYGRGDLEKPTAEELRIFRAEAEKAARQLRAEGETAFYYHGPNMSMVTVGVLSEEDHDGSTQPPIESIRLRQLRERFPYNMLNGQGIRETIRTERGPVERLQDSRLVAIPDR